MTIQEGINQVERANKMIQESTHLINDAIKTAFLFTWQWWLGIALFSIPWIFWFWLRKKDSTTRLLTAGLISIIMGLLIDQFAISTGKWLYPIKFIPNSGALLLPYHFSMLPVGIMFALQIKPNVNPVIKGLVFGILGAYIMEPFFEMFGFYAPKGWPYTYDVVIYLTLYLVAHWFSTMNNFEKIRSDDKVEYKYRFNFLRRKQKVR